MFYADTVAESDDPFFIVPAVVPDDSSVTRANTGSLPRTEAVPTQEMQSWSQDQSLNTISTALVEDEPSSFESVRRSVVARQLAGLNHAHIVSLVVQKDAEQGTTVVVVIELDGV